MNLPKAIEILELNLRVAGKAMPPDTQEALKLGIEAQHFIIENRHKCSRSVFTLLPGETD